MWHISYCKQINKIPIHINFTDSLNYQKKDINRLLIQKAKRHFIINSFHTQIELLPREESAVYTSKCMHACGMDALSSNKDDPKWSETPLFSVLLLTRMSVCVCVSVCVCDSCIAAVFVCVQLHIHVSLLNRHWNMSKGHDPFCVSNCPFVVEVLFWLS